jgi:hypothetical protein
VQRTDGLGEWRRRAGGRRRRATAVATPLIAFVVGAVVVGAVVVRAAPARHPGAPRPSRPACAAVDTPARADVDGDGCDEPLVLDRGSLLAGTRRLSVGAPGDHIALGRWTCGASAPAVLRPSTGEVFRFDGWAAPGRPVDGVPVATVTGAVELHAVPGQRPECDDLAVTRAAGDLAVVWRAP